MAILLYFIKHTEIDCKLSGTYASIAVSTCTTGQQSDFWHYCT